MLACMSACAEVGFDKATQKTFQFVDSKRPAEQPAEQHGVRRVRCRKKTRQPAPGAEPARHTTHRPANVGGRSELSHSFVSCAHVGTCNYGSADIDAVHRLILPARRVSSTDHNSVGAALVASIEEYICGSTFQEWCMRYKAKGVEDVEICLSMDSHSANAKMADILSIYVKSLGSAIGIRISVFISRCGLHRGSRICVRILEKHNLHAVFYGLSNALRMRKTSRQIHNVFSGLDHECLDIWRFPPVLSDRDVRLVKTLRDMLSMKWRRSSRRGEGVSKMTFGMNQDMEWAHVLDVTLEGVPPPWVDMPQGKLVRHRCVGLCAFGSSDRVNCTSDACTRTLVCDAFCKCFTTRSFGRFQTGRWTKTLLFLKKAGGAMLISPLSTTAVLKCKLLSMRKGLGSSQLGWESCARRLHIHSSGSGLRSALRLLTTPIRSWSSTSLNLPASTTSPIADLDVCSMRMMKMGARGNTKIEQARGGSNIECMRCLQIYGKP